MIRHMDGMARLVWLGRALVLLLLLLAGAPGWAADAAGVVIAARGQVTASNAAGELRELVRGGEVFAGDTLSTGANSFVRLKFSDGGTIYLRAGTRFVIDDYKYQQPGQEDAGKFNLIRGGFRAVTGAIGREDQRQYAVQTPVSTIGIRGTDYRVRLCLGDCIDLVQQGFNVPEDGLYGGVDAGAIDIGGLPIPAGQYSFTTLGGQTVLLNVAPDVFRVEIMPDPSLEEGEAEGEEGSAEFEIPPGGARTVTLECPI